MKNLNSIFRFWISIITISSLTALPVHAQFSKAITRGASSDEIIINCTWYEILNSTTSEINYGNIYTPNHGQNIAFYADSLFFNLTGDQTPGLIYGSDVVNYNYLIRSFDNGQTWDTTKFYQYKNIYEGSKPGELFAIGSVPPYDVLYISSDSGATFSVCYENMPFVNQTITAGPIAGQCYSLTNGYLINYTSNYWQNYQGYPLDTNITSGILDFICMMAGGGDGELYLVSKKSENDTLLLNIYRSIDHGQSFSLQYTWNDYQPWNYSIAFVAGREPGVFYIIKGSYEFNSNTEVSATIIEFYYSIDGGVTYNQYYHNLYNDYFVGETPLPSVPSISLSPNPATDAVWLRSLPTSVVVTAIEISNLSGQSVFNYNCSQAVLQGQSLQVILPPTLAAGCYVVKVIAGNRVVGREKLMIIK